MRFLEQPSRSCKTRANMRLEESAVPEVYLEIHRTYNLLSNCSYNPIISRVIVVMGLILGLCYNYSY